MLLRSKYICNIKERKHNGQLLLQIYFNKSQKADRLFWWLKKREKRKLLNRGKILDNFLRNKINNL